MHLELHMKTPFADCHYSCAKQEDETAVEWLARAIAGAIEVVEVNHRDSEEFKHKMALAIVNNAAYEQRDKLKKALEEESDMLDIARADVFARFKIGHVLTAEDRELLLVYLSLKTETRKLLESLESED